MSRYAMLLAVVVWGSVVVHEVFATESSSFIYLKTGTLDTSQAQVSVDLQALSRSTKYKYYLVQFKGAFQKDYATQLKKLGVEFVHYIPDHAFIVKAQEKVRAHLGTVSFIRWIGNYEPFYKMDATLQAREAKNPESRVMVNVRLFPGENKAALKKVVEAHEGKVLQDGKRVIQIEILRKYLGDLAELTSVEWMEPAKALELFHFTIDNGRLKPGEGKVEAGENPIEAVDTETGVKLLEVATAYEHNLKGSGQLVAVADTGLDLGDSRNLSDDFRDAVYAGYALGFLSSSWEDAMGHGTHVSGSILGRGRYSNGRFVGVAPEAQLIMQGVMGFLGLMMIPPDLNELFEPVYKDGARIHSNSWGSQSVEYDQASQTADEFIWNHPDMLVVFAAGNSGVDANKDGVIDDHSLGTPANAKNVLTVGASENVVLEGGIQKKWGEVIKEGDNPWAAEPIASDLVSNHQNGIAAFSSRGPTSDGRLKPEIVAPGTNILSARSHHQEAQDLWGKYNEHYVWCGGTSMSTPLVSGASVLVRQYYQTVMKEGRVSAALVKATLLNGAIDLYPGQFGNIGFKEIPAKRPNIHEGWGRLSVDKTLFSKDRSLKYDDVWKGLATGESESYPIRVLNAKETLKVTLTYTDHPAAAAAQKVLVNDLDLTIQTPSGKTLYPNGGSEADHINNVEGIDVEHPEKGVYTVKVSAYDVPSGKEGAQPYALVISGGIE